MSSLKDFNAYENMPELRMSAMMNRRQQDPINQFNEESQVLSLGTYKNGDETEQRSGLIKQGYYQHFKGNEYPGDQIQTRNLYQSIKGENELYIDGQTDFRNQLDSNIFPGPIRQKIKGNKYRKKSKLKEAKLLKGKESVNSNSINKPKAYKLGQTKARLEASESTAKNSSGKSSSNSFIFMKNNPHSLRKASSHVPNIGDEQQDNQDQISTSDKNTGASTQPTTIGEKASMIKSGAKVK
uniref:Uncharacterized protein n=1 Tax=Euplotes crassus TaxID=5936 RepID=A0A7S3KJD5_EUPCR